jgi:hypothetical protein
MSKNNTSAFPILKTTGMELRDYFAAKAMQGWLANSIDKLQGVEPMWHKSNEQIAEICYQMADAMLAARQLPSHKHPLQ